MKIVDYVDALGITRRVALPDPWTPDDGDPSEGIPVSLDLDGLYGDLPPEFRRKLYAALWQQGLVTAADYLQPGASDKFRRAITSVAKFDFIEALQRAREETQHGK